MVYLKRSAPEFDAAATNFPAKWEVAEEERENGQLNKRSKLSNIGENVFNIPPEQYNPLDEPSPLGLRLRKSPSLLDLIQLRLSQANASSTSTLQKKAGRANTASALTEKLKASNFPAMLLRIGEWEFVSRFDGDLVAKCYFAKRKLVWEILQDGLKSKIEIQWPYITAMKVNLPDDGPGTLSITLLKPPRFFRETNPQPRKHTLWQDSVDFTDGKASIFRQHILQCPPGVLNKQYEKLIRCDTHLNLVSQQTDTNQLLPYFDERVPFFKNPNTPEVREVGQLDVAKRSPVYVSSPSPSSSFNFDGQNSVGLTPEHVSIDAAPPSSGMDLHGSGGSSSQGEDGIQAQDNWEQLNALGVNKSMSMSDLVNHIGRCISKRMANGNSPCSNEALESQHMLENIGQFLFNDANLATSSDEKKLMSRVNSLCCLLQDPSVGPSLDTEIQFESLIESEKQPMGMLRKDSFSDLLLSLPKIASLPKFLFDISEDDENQAR